MSPSETDTSLDLSRVAFRCFCRLVAFPRIPDRCWYLGLCVTFNYSWKGFVIPGIPAALIAELSCDARTLNLAWVDRSMVDLEEQIDIKRGNTSSPGTLFGYH